MATQGSSSGGECGLYSSNKDPVSSVLLTLPITCQICLGKVKDPVICPNQHVFCGVCMTQWLNSNQICPTCRIPVNENQPCKRIIGSLDCSHPSPDRDVKEQLRRTRFELLFQEYEGEIGTLETQLDDALADNKRLTTCVSDLNKKLEESEERFLRAINSGSNGKEKINGDTVSTDINTILKLSSKLQDLIQVNNRLKDENMTLKEKIKLLDADKAKLSEQVKKVVEENSFPRSPQKYGKYTITAMQTKVDNYEREIQRLKRALDRSDEYIDQLNSELRDERGHGIEIRNPRISEHASKESEVGETSGNQSKGAMANGQPSFPVRRQINLTVGKSPLNHVATAAFTPSSGAFMAVEKEQLPNFSVACNGDLTVGNTGHVENTQRETTPTNTMEAGSTRCSDLPATFSGPLNTEAPQKANLGTDGGSDSFADPVRFPACAKLIQLTKAHRMLSNTGNSRTRSGADLTSTTSTSPDNTSITSTTAAASVATVVVSPRNNLVDLLLKPRENARKDRERQSDSPNREGQANATQKAYLSPSHAVNREDDISESPLNADKTPSPPALISTLGEASGTYEYNTKSPRHERSPPPLSYCGGYSTTTCASYTDSTVSTGNMKNDAGEPSNTRMESEERDEFSAYPLSPKRIKLEPQD